MNLKTAVSRAIAATPLDPSDQAAAQLALKQAAAIDADPEALKKLGPHLLETLIALGLAPKSRSTRKEPTTFDGARAKLLELRNSRAG